MSLLKLLKEPKGYNVIFSLKILFMILKRLLIIILFSISTYTYGDFNAQVVRIVDGDTIQVIDSNGIKFKIRLLGIDTPEPKQRFGYESSLSLKKIIDGKSVIIISKTEKNKPYTLGRYKRIIGKIILNGKDINLEMVQKGMAWHYKKYIKSQNVEDRQSYNNAEQDARLNKIGLWSDVNPVAPWEWRKLNK
jgi:endonuclease YncB( thermonuclease family)